MREIKKHITLIGIFTKRYIMSQMEYRSSFFTILIIETLILMSKLLYTVVIYSTDIVIEGLKPEAIMMFTGTFFIISAVYGAFFMFNFTTLRQSIYDGSLDLAITKPISLQFYATVSTIDIAVAIPNFIAGVIMVGKSFQELHVPVTVITIGGYCFYVIMGIVLLYSILLLPHLVSFWLIKSEGLNEIVSSISNFNIMPMAIYPKTIQLIGTFFIPIFIVSNYPPMFVLGLLGRNLQIWGVVVPILLFVIARIMWKLSIRHYSSIAN